MAFAQHMVDLMRTLGRVQVRAMFGGHGLYLDGLMFALALDERLYLKADDHNEDRFLEHGLRPFTYLTKDGKTGHLRYHEAPAEAYENPEVMAQWARLAHEAAVRAKIRPASRAKAAVARPSRNGSVAGGRQRESGSSPAAGHALAALRNLGPASAAMLVKAGIRTPAQLRQLGAVRAFDRVRRIDPKASLNLLWAIEGALSDRPWQLVAEVDQASLLMALEDMKLLRG